MQILTLLSLIIPPLIYSGIIYFTSPYKSIDLKTSAYYFIAGILSTSVLMLLNIALPYDMSESVSNPFDFYFFGVAVHEEISKFLAFIFVHNIFKKKRTHPIGMMFYMGMVGLGFAMIENANYLLRYGEYVLAIRNVTSTLAHMIFGMFTGYWISLSKTKMGKFGNRSLFDIVLLQDKRIMFAVYSIVGLSCGIAYHRLWNYNLSESGKASTTIMIILIFAGIIGCKFAADSLNKNKKTQLTER